MERTRGYITELDLNNTQRTVCLQHAGVARFAYNWGLARKRAALALRKAASDPKSVRIPSAIDLHKELNALKKTEFPWMYEASKCAPQEALRALDVAFKNWFKKRARFPHYKQRSKRIGSFTLTGTIHVGADWVQLPVIGKVRIFEHNYVPKDTGIEIPTHYLSATVSEHAGHWFVSVQVTEIVSETEPASGEPVGIDLGIKELATCSDETTIHNPKALRGRLKALRRANKALARKKKGSKNRAKAKRRLARLHYRISNIREDTLQQATTQIVAKTKPPSARPEAMILEDLNVKGMLKNRKLSRAIADVGLGTFRRYLTYKASWYGSTLAFADRFYPSTQLCSGCHRLPSVYLDLRVRTYVCEHCGLMLDRDLNAACNLKWLYTASSAELQACGEYVRPEVFRHFRLCSVKQELDAG